MKKTSSILLAFFMSVVFVNAQGITTHAYRKVAPENMQEYLKRETTYWQKFAEQEVKKGNLTFWGIFQKVGGINQENSPNILIINTFNNIDEQLDWNSVGDLFPDVKMTDISTNGLSVNTATIFLRSLDNHVNIPNVVPKDDYNFVKVIYHNPKNTGTLVDFEENKWKPMIQKAMEDGKTTMKGWGNSAILHPSSGKFPYTHHSYDLFTSLKDVLSPVFSEDIDLDENFFADIMDNDESPRNNVIFRIISVVTASSEGE